MLLGYFIYTSHDSGHKVGYKRHRIVIRGREAGRGSDGYDGSLGWSIDGSWAEQHK